MHDDIQPYHFRATIDRYDFGTYHYTVVYLPKDVLEHLPLTRNLRLRVNVLVEGYIFNGALMPDVLGSKQTQHLQLTDDRPAGTRIWYLMVSKRILTVLGKKEGDQVSLRISVADQNEVDVPEELQQRLHENRNALEVWERLTPGKKRGLVHPINTAKTLETRMKRIDSLEEWLLDN